MSELARVLADPDRCAFDTATLIDQPAGHVTAEVERFFAGRTPSDVLLLYFSGHGIKDSVNALHLATRDTRLSDLATTSVSAEFISACVQRSRSRRILLVLDCCYSGAFPRGMVVRADQTVHIQEEFGGRGLVIITASSAIEYAFEDGNLTEEFLPHTSLFTSALIDGLDSGAADLNHDGEITVDELYDFAFDTVREKTPAQTPCRWMFGAQGRLVIGRTSVGSTPRRPPRFQPAPLTLRPARRLGIIATGPLVAAAGLLWLGTQVHVLAALVAGTWLALLALRILVTSQRGAVELTRDGVQVRGVWSKAVRWPAVLAIEVRPTLTGRSVALRRADTAIAHRLTLPTPRTAMLARDVEFDERIQTLRRWSENWGSPAPVTFTSNWTAARAGLARAVVILMLFLVVDQPWTWYTPPQAVALPSACDVLNESRQRMRWDNDAIFRFHVGEVSGNESTQYSSHCQVDYYTIIFQVGTRLNLQYELLPDRSTRSGTQRATSQLRSYAGQDREEGLTVQELSADDGLTGYAAVPPSTARADQQSPFVARVRTRQVNVVVTVQFHTVDPRVPPPAIAELTAVASDAVGRIDVQGRTFRPPGRG
ncbi:hypothetical protein AWW66_19580 [Micromonospora rosaria]|uniref:Peptidase C14 caspase domain-containing protein n=1 Tax=Micromonospora rosaria TaxID=47874 RepID=A0A136PPK6_9ACTN|nr:hypothetical protein AWW66_19580 [Micromonospora rosaria]